MLCLKAVIFVLISRLSISDTAEIEINLVQRPIILGEKVKLSCKIMSNTNACQDKEFKSCDYTWERQCNEERTELIMSSKKTNYTDKFKQLYSDNHNERILVIFNFDQKDFYCEYYCAYYLFKTTNPIQFKKNDCIRKPKTNNVMVLPEIKNDILYVDFRIKEVYPKPDCRATFSENKNEQINIKIDFEDEETNTLSLTLQSNFETQIHSDVMDLSLRIICRVNKTVIFIDTTRILPYHGDNCAYNYSTITVLVLSILLGIAIISLIVCGVYTFFRHWILMICKSMPKVKENCNDQTRVQLLECTHF